MGRRKGSAAKDLVEITSRVPWWVGVLLAAISYLLLHAVAGRPVVIDPKAPSFVGIVLKGFATPGQYLLPILFLAGAGMSAVRRRQASALVAGVAARNDAGPINEMSWREFEVLVGEAFRLQGYAVTETGGGGADGGVDLVLTRDGEKSLVQCKQWKAYKVGVDVVRELYGVMAAQGAAGGFVVTSGRFTDEATKFASGRNIRLVDGAKLHALIRQSTEARARRASATMTPVPRREAPASSSIAPPACPTCALPMVRRVAKRGTNAGNEFWGCTGYPICKSVRPLK